MKKQYRIVHNEHLNTYKVQYRYVQGWFNMWKSDWLTIMGDNSYTTLEEARLSRHNHILIEEDYNKRNEWKVVA